jgi:hypothetical protein
MLSQPRRVFDHRTKRRASQARRFNEKIVSRDPSRADVQLNSLLALLNARTDEHRSETAGSSESQIKRSDATFRRGKSLLLFPVLFEWSEDQHRWTGDIH